MKYHKIAFAVAALASAASSQAALSTTDATNLDAAQGQVLFVAGASAVQKGFTQLITNLLNNPVYYNNDGKTAVKDSSYIAVVGQLKADYGTGATKWAAGSSVLIQYRNSGGSIYGVNNVARVDANTKALNVTSATCGAVATATGSSSLPYDCTFGTRAPDVGVSDVHPKYFTGPYNLEGETPVTQLTTTELNKLTVKPLYAQAFGIPVTNTVTSSAVLNRATVSAIMTGAISNWKQVPTDGTDTAFPSNAGDSSIVICRRIPGSGSQAVMNMWSAGFPCSTNAGAPVDRNANQPGVFDGTSYTVGNAPAGSLIVIENNSSGDVRKCLDAAVNGGSYNTTDRTSAGTIKVDFGSGGYKAIGVLSLDSLSASRSTPDTSTSPATGQWQFRALNGAGQITGENITPSVGPITTFTTATNSAAVLPTLDNLRTGNWDMQGWTTMQYINTGTGALSATKKAFANALIAEAQSLSVMTSAKELKWTAAILPTGSNASSQTLNVGYPNKELCSPLSRAY